MEGAGGRGRHARGHGYLERRGRRSAAIAAAMAGAAASRPASAAGHPGRSGRSAAGMRPGPAPNASAARRVRLDWNRRAVTTVPGAADVLAALPHPHSPVRVGRKARGTAAVRRRCALGDGPPVPRGRGRGWAGGVGCRVGDGEGEGTRADSAGDARRPRRDRAVRWAAQTASDRRCPPPGLSRRGRKVGRADGDVGRDWRRYTCSSQRRWR